MSQALAGTGRGGLRRTIPAPFWVSGTTKPGTLLRVRASRCGDLSAMRWAEVRVLIVLELRPALGAPGPAEAGH